MALFYPDDGVIMNIRSLELYTLEYLICHLRCTVRVRAIACVGTRVRIRTFNFLSSYILSVQLLYSSYIYYNSAQHYIRIYIRTDQLINVG